MPLGKKFGDAYIEVHAKTEGAIKDLLEVEAVMEAMDDDKTIRIRVKKNKDFDALGNTMKNLGRQAERTGARITRAAEKSRKRWNPFHTLMQKMNKSWARMDSTVRLVIGLIATSGGPASAAMSGLSAAIAAVASSAALALSALAPLVGVLPGLAYGAGLAVAGLQDLEKYSAGAYSALGDLKQAFTDVDVPAFMAQWTPALEGFFSTLANSLAADKFATGLGQSFAAITDALTGLVESAGFKAFISTFEPGGPMQAALSSLGTGFVSVLEGLLTFFAAAAPYAQQLAESFAQWGAEWAAGIGQAVQDPAFANFFELAMASLSDVLELTGALGDLLGTIFVAGAESGNSMISTLSGVITEFNNFLNTVGGQQVLADFFARGESIMGSLSGVLVGLAEAFDNMITPETTALFNHFAGTLSVVLPILGEMLEVISHLGILNLVAELFFQIGSALEPVLPILKELAEKIFSALFQVIQSLAPILGTVAELIGVLAEALMPIVGQLGDAFIDIFQTLAPVIASLVEGIKPLIPIIGDILSKAIAAVLPVIMELINALGPVLTAVVQALLPIFQALVPIIESLLPVFTALLPILFPVINLIAELAPVITPLIDLVAQLVVWLLELIAPVIDLIAPLLELVAEFIVVNAAIGKISQAFAGLGGWFTKVFKWFDDLIVKVRVWVSETLDVFRGFGTGVSNFFTNFINGFRQLWDDFFGGLGQRVLSWVDEVVSFWTNLWTKVTTGASNGISTIVNGFKNFFTTLIEGVRKFVLRFVQFYVDMVTKVVTTVANFVANIIGRFRAFYEKVAEVVSLIVSHVTGHFTGMGKAIGETVVNLVSGVMRSVRGFRDNIIAVFLTIANRINGFWEGIGETIRGVTDFITGIPDKIGSAFSSIGDTVGGLLDNIPGFAAGGIVTGPTTALVGEAGPEAIVPLNRPLNRVDPSVRAISAQLQGGQTTSFASGGIVGGGVTIAEGAIVVHAPESNPALVAESVIDRLAAYSR